VARLALASAVALALIGGVAGSAPAATTHERAARHGLTLAAPKLRATGVDVAVSGGGASPGKAVAIDLKDRAGYSRVALPRANAAGRYRVTLRRPRQRPGHILVRARVGSSESPDAVSAPFRINFRDIRLAAVGDINLGDGVASQIAAHGPRYPWSGVAPALRSADIAFGNLECAITTRGRAEQKTYTFRGSPGSLAVARRYAGLDVVNLANNHSGDYGHVGFFDTLANVHKQGMIAVGAGRNLSQALRARVVTRLGLRIGFVGFEEILPANFWAGAHRPGVPFASVGNVRRAVRAARRRSDVVVATFHWGIERQSRPTARQVQLANAALGAGADLVIGAHPHVLQQIQRRGHRLVAYSLGNFVFSANSPATASTGVLNLRLSTRGVERSSFRRARISASRPHF